jgi:titin
METSATNSYLATGLSMGNNYKFKIVAVNSAGSSLISPESDFIIAAVPPSAPTNVVRLNADQTFITIGWQAPSQNGGSPIIGYYILWDAGQGGISYTQIGTSTLDT